MNLTVKAKAGRIPPPVALVLPPPVPELAAVGKGVPWGTKVGKGGGAATSKAKEATAATASGLRRYPSNISTTEIH